jgi:chaperonin GroES
VKARKASSKAGRKPVKNAARPAARAGARAEAKAPGQRPAPHAGRAGTTRAEGGRSMSKVRPLRDRILVKRVEEAEQRVGGIIVPDTAREKPQQAEVVAVGSGRVLEDGSTAPLTVRAGDRVLVGKWSGTDVKIDGQEYLIIKEDEVLGILG